MVEAAEHKRHFSGPVCCKALLSVVHLVRSNNHDDVNHHDVITQRSIRFLSRLLRRRQAHCPKSLFRHGPCVAHHITLCCGPLSERYPGDEHRKGKMWHDLLQKPVKTSTSTPKFRAIKLLFRRRLKQTSSILVARAQSPIPSRAARIPGNIESDGSRFRFLIQSACLLFSHRQVRVSQWLKFRYGRAPLAPELQTLAFCVSKCTPIPSLDGVILWTMRELSSVLASQPKMCCE